MNGLTIGIITFVVWISAKGELANYIKLAKQKNVTDNDLKLNKTPNVPPLPQLKN